MIYYFCKTTEVKFHIGNNFSNYKNVNGGCLFQGSRGQQGPIGYPGPRGVKVRM